MLNAKLEQLRCIKKVRFVLLQAIKLLFRTFHCGPNLALKDFQVWSIEKEVDYLQI